VASCCCWGVGFSGYEAATVCRSVHDARPNCSTSGGHSVEICVDGVDKVVVAVGDVDVVGLGVGRAFVICLQLRISVQERHLYLISSE
jgi:hypothetical protein